MGMLLQDLRYGFRMLAKSPGFTAVAVLTLALGIGANTAIFSLIDAVMLRSIPVHDPSRLVVFRWQAHHTPNGSYSSFGDCPTEVNNTNASGCSFPLPVFENFRSEVKAVSDVTAFAGPAQLDLTGNGSATMVNGEIVDGNFFSTLGVNATLGRTIGPADDSPSAPSVAVLSYAYWQSAFGGERSVLGRTIQLNKEPFTIVGVAEPGFTSLSPGKKQDLWFPIADVPRLGIFWGQNIKKIDNWWLVIMGRLKPGVSLGQLQAAANLVFRNQLLYGAKPEYKAVDDPKLNLAFAQGGLTGERGQFSRPLYILMFAVTFILLIACANVGGLLLARAARRQKEMAVRLAVGAERGRLLRQLLTESVMLSAAGGALGILFAYWGVHAITALISSNPENPFPFAVTPDWRVLAFTISISLFSGILFGLAPAFRATRLELTPALKDNVSLVSFSAAHSIRRFHGGSALVIFQVALSILVLIGAGLLMRTLQNLRNINPGFDARNVLLFGVDPTLAGYKDAQISSLYHDLQDRFAALPGVISTSYSSDSLLSNSLWTSDLHVEGQPENTTVEIDMLSTGPEFFKTMQIPVLYGRALTSQDFALAAQVSRANADAEKPVNPAAASHAAGSPVPVAPPVPVLVNATFVRQYLAKQNPLGKRLRQGNNESSSGDTATEKPKSGGWIIAGVVGDARYDSLRREVHPTVYLPLTGGGAHFELRTAADPAPLIPAVRDVVNRVASNLPLFDVHTQSEKIDQLLTEERVIARLSGFFGLLALMLSCIGLYGLLSYEVSRRTREIGIRMALGAERSHVLKMVLREGIGLTLAGVLFGIAAALGLTRLMAGLLYDVHPTDPATFAIVALTLSGVAIAASCIPARRATKVDPMVALRYE